MLDVDKVTTTLVAPPLQPTPAPPPTRLCDACRQDVPQPAVFCPACGWRLATSGSHAPLSPPQPVQPAFSQERIASERKPVTALSCALDDTARHLATTAPDTFHGIIRHLFELALPEVERYGGTITQFLEDGFFALFGASTVHEDHPRRAVLAALAVQQQFKVQIGQHTPPGSDGRPLTIRMGLHTGRVFVSRVGDAVHLTSTAIEGMNDWAIACQRQAMPDTILLSEATMPHVRDIVRLETADPIEGMPSGDQTYQVMAYQWRYSSRSRWGRQRLSTYVGRQQELEILNALLHDVRAGRGQVVGIVGEPGMGKSRLLYEFRRQLADGETLYSEGHCVSYGDVTPYLPLRDALRQTWRLSDADPPDAIEHKVKASLKQAGMGSDEEVAYLMHLLNVPGDWPALAHLSPEAIKTRMFDTLRRFCLGRSQRQPLVIVVEDLHWIDATSEEFLNSLVQHMAGAAILLLTSYRQGYQPKWMTKSYATQIALTRLPRQASVQVMQESLGDTPPTDDLTRNILSKADGNPFFLEELARVMAKRRHGAALHMVPDTIQAVLAARIDQLDPPAKQLLQTAAVIGKDVPYALLSLLANLPEDQLTRHLSALQTAEFIHVRRDVPEHAYTFKHALIQEVAYHSLLDHTRQREHERIAHLLETQLPDTVEAQPELLAHHYTQANMTDQAIATWYRAGRHAMAQSAYVEAIAHLNRGLDLLSTLPETPERSQQSLAFHIWLGPSLMAIKGYASPEVEEAYTQAQGLCERVGDLSQQFVTLWGLWGLRLVHVDLKRTQAMSEQMVDIAQRLNHPLSLQRAHFAMAMLSFIQGELKTAKVHIDRGLDIEEEERRHSYRDIQHPRVGCMAYHAFYLWMRGDSDQAAAQADDAMALARALRHPLSETFAMIHAAVLYQFRRQWPKVLELSETAIQLASEQGFAYFTAAGAVLRGWATAASGDPATGLARMQEGIDAYRSTGAELHVPYLLSMLADGYRQMHQVDAGLRVLEEALMRVRQTGECWWEAELYRLQGDYLILHSECHTATAETHLRRAVDLAHQRGTQALELRAGVSLGRLWLRQGQPQQTRRLIGKFYRGLTEGLETPDLQEVQQLYSDCTRG